MDLEKLRRMDMDERECQGQAARIEALLQEVAALPEPRVRARVEELLRALLDMYGAGLTRMVEMAGRAEVAGQALLQTFAGDELVGSLLLLHGLHPVGLEERVRQAIEKIRPSVQKQGGKLELLRVEERAVTLSLLLTGGCQGCGSSTQALKQTIENAVYGAAPELDELCFEETAMPQHAAIPVTFVPPRRPKQQTLTSEQIDAHLASKKDQAGISRTR
jgi:Fe-S cluster biogenesis protein NfuA